MKVINKSAKVVGVNGVYVMPDQEIDLSKETMSLSAVKSYLRLGIFEEVDNSKAEMAAELEQLKKEKAAREAAEKKAAEEAAAKAAAEKKAAEEAAKEKAAKEKAPKGAQTQE